MATQTKFGGVKRADLKDSEFVFPDERSFPIKTAADVSDAVSSWGRYRGKHSFDEFKRGVKRRASAIGAMSSLPENWKEEMKQDNMDRAQALIHFGVLGMHWGKRKTSSSGHADSEAAKTLKRKKISDLSNEELKKLNNRMQLEKQYKELKAADISEGRKFVTGVLKDSGKNVATKFVTAFLDKAVATALNPETWNKVAKSMPQPP